MKTESTTAVCYSQINAGTWCNEWYETSTKHGTQRARQLRRAGFSATCSAMGYQVTQHGRVRMSILHIGPGRHADTLDLPTEDWKLSR